MSVLIIFILIIGCIIGLSIKRKSIQTVGNELGKQAVLSVFSIKLENQYIEFEKLFREQQDDIKKLAEGLFHYNVLEKKEYFIQFNEKWYLKSRSNHLFGILYDGNAFKSAENEEIIEILNENTDLKEALNSIIDKGVIIQIVKYRSGDMWILEFDVDPKFTPFITGNNGVINAFKYCEGEGWDENSYYKRVADNWYLWISPAPE